MNEPQSFSKLQKVEKAFLERSKKSSTLYIFLSLALGFVVSMEHFEENWYFYALLTLIFFFSGWRFYIANQCLKKEVDPHSLNSLLHRYLILPNAILWSILNVVLLMSPMTLEVKYFVVIFLASALSVGSIISLAPNRNLQMIFPITILLPMAITVFFIQVHTNLFAQLFNSLSLLFCLVYCIRQGRDVSNSFFQSLEYEESLIAANLELLESAKVIKLESEKSMHSARLASLGEMAGGLAHEINNPLMIIKSQTALIDKELLANFNSEQTSATRSRLQKLNNATDRVAQVVRSLRSFAMQDTVAPFEEITLLQVFNEVLIFFGESLKSQNVKFYFDEQQLRNIRIYCRPQQIIQVFLSLLKNSIDATKGTVSPWIRCEVLNYNDCEVELAFQDSGPGLSSEVKQKLFQPFFTTKPIGSGAGLGLSESRGILTQHKGSIKFDDKSTITTFLINLPTQASTKQSKIA